MSSTDRKWICPECKASKHGNCDGTAWDDDKDDFTSCACDHDTEETQAAIADARPARECTHAAEVAVDWVEGLVLHEGDDDWHPWDASVFGKNERQKQDHG